MARSDPPASVKCFSQKPPIVPPPETRRRSGGLRWRALAATVCQRSLVVPNLVGAGDDESPVRRHYIAERYL